MNEKLHKIWTRDYDLYLCYGAGRSLFNDKEHLKYPVQQVLISPNAKNKELYITESEFQKLWKLSNDYYIKNIENFIPYCKELISAGEKFFNKCSEFSNGVSGVKNNVLSDRYVNFLEAFIDYFKYLWSSFVLNEEMTDTVSKFIDNLSLDVEEKQDLLTYATRPIRSASIMLLAEEAKHKNIDQLTKDFAWITTLNIYDNPATENDIKNRIKSHGEDLSEIPKVLTNLEESLQNLIEASRYNTYIKDRRDDYRRMGTYKIIPLFEEIAKRLKLTRNEISFLLPDEITNALIRDGNSLKEKVRVREEDGFLIWWHDNKMDFEESTTKIEKIRKNLGIKNIFEKNINQFGGIIGCKGNSIGKVKILATAKELSKVQKGDVMVSVTTNPDYLPGMELSSAFITDEGGITCHAAIVAREMKKPCIVGTKIATKVLKDGDLVEVDANEGVVRIIKRVNEK